MSTSPAEVASTTSAEHALPGVQHRYRAVADFHPLGLAWLGHRERAELAAWRDADRRRAWLVGRTIGKTLVARRMAKLPTPQAIEPSQIEILSRDAEGRVNRPRIWCDGIEKPWSLSISHSQRGVLAAFTAATDVALGVDLADCGTFGDGFVDLWFTPAERAWFHETQCTSTARFIWAAKEALYKACNDGESFTPRDVEVLPDGRCSYHETPLAGCRLRSWRVDGHLAVLATVHSTRNSDSISSTTHG